MSRKDYQMIARWLSRMSIDMNINEWKAHCAYVADELGKENNYNNNFNRSKFLEACGVS